VESLVAGSLPVGYRASLTLEIPLFGGLGELEDLRASLQQRGLYFLRNKGTSAAAAGMSPAQQRDEAAFYRLMTFDSAIFDRGGLAQVGEARDYLAALSGIAFVDAVAAVRRAGR
jgi:hypothetical protein